MKINLDQVLVGLNGDNYKQDGKDLTVGQILASCLDTGRETGRMKLFVLAKKCYDGGTAEFDDADLSMMKKLVETSSITSNVIIGQVLLALDGTK